MNVMDDITISENAYFFLRKKKEQESSGQKNESKTLKNIDYLSKSKIKKIFQEVSNKKTGWYLLNIPAQNTRVKSNGTDKDVHYSICVFKIKSTPSLIKLQKKEEKKWFEIKVCQEIVLRQ